MGVGGRPALSDPFDLPGADVQPLGGLQGAGAALDILDLLDHPTPGIAPGTGTAPRPETQNPFADALALDPFLAGPAAPAETPLSAPRPTPFEHVHFRPPEIGPSPAPVSAPVSAPGAVPDRPLVPDDYDLLADALGTPAVDPFAAFESSPEPLPPVTPSASLERAPAPSLILSRIEPLPGSSPEAVAAGSTTASELAANLAKSGPAPASEVLPHPTPGAAPVPTPAAADSGLAAFLAGLGAGSVTQIHDPERFLRDAGALLRALTQGLTATMQARAQFKSELRLGVTTIRAAENNPFKFSVGVDDALERLLLRPGPGFLPPVDAARGACEDIQAHEMAMIAGLRAALRALLARFEPAELERRMGVASGLDKLLPMARRSHYWDLFNETYDQVAADAADDFMQLFGDAFTRAYEDQIHRLAQARQQQRVDGR